MVTGETSRRGLAFQPSFAISPSRCTRAASSERFRRSLCVASSSCWTRRRESSRLSRRLSRSTSSIERGSFLRPASRRASASSAAVCADLLSNPRAIYQCNRIGGPIHFPSSRFVVGTISDELVEERGAGSTGGAIDLEQVADREHADEFPVVDHGQVTAAQPMHLLQSGIHVFVRVGNDEVPGHHRGHRGLFGIEPGDDDAGHEVTLGKDANQLSGVEDGQRTDVALAHLPGYITDLVGGAGVKERMAFDQLRDLLHIGSSRVTFGFRARLPRPSYAAYLYASPSVGKLKTASMNALMVPPNCMTIIPTWRSSEA